MGNLLRALPRRSRRAAEPKLPARSELGVILFYAGILAAIGVALMAEGAVRVAALGALGLFGIYFFVGDFFQALADERAAARFPHANRNSDVGRAVQALGDFVSGAGTSVGRVLLSGEVWNARTVDGALHGAGTELVVLRVEGLVLVVAEAAGDPTIDHGGSKERVKRNPLT